MDFSHYFTITGKAGLFKFVGQTKTGIIVESLIDKKRLPAYNNQKIVSLDDISVFLVEEDIPLRDVMKKIYDKFEGKKAEIDLNADKNKMFLHFGEIIPEFDSDRVYPSDIKKIFQWYNQLVANDLIRYEEVVAEVETEQAEVKKPAKKAAAKKETQPADEAVTTEPKKKATKKTTPKAEN